MTVNSLSAGAPTTFPVGSSASSYDPVTVTPTNSVNFSVYVKNSFTNPVSSTEQISIVLQGVDKPLEKIEFAIYNLVGEKLYSAVVITDEKTELTLRPELKLPSGVYMAESRYDGTVQRIKFVVN